MDQQENEQTALSQGAAGVVLSLLTAFAATVWWFYRQNRTSESPNTPNLDVDQSVFKPITEPGVQEEVGPFEDTEETEENIVT